MWRNTKTHVECSQVRISSTLFRQALVPWCMFPYININRPNYTTLILFSNLFPYPTDSFPFNFSPEVTACVALLHKLWHCISSTATSFHQPSITIPTTSSYSYKCILPDRYIYNSAHLYRLFISISLQFHYATAAAEVLKYYASPVPNKIILHSVVHGSIVCPRPQVFICSKLYAKNLLVFKHVSFRIILGRNSVYYVWWGVNFTNILLNIPLLLHQSFCKQMSNRTHTP